MVMHTEKLMKFTFFTFLCVIYICYPIRQQTTQESLYDCLQRIQPNISITQPVGENYSADRVGWNLRYEQEFPILIINVRHVEDILASLKCASNFSVTISVMNGGHSFEGLSTNNGGLLLNMDDFSEVLNFNSIDGSITIQSGMRLGRLYGEVVARGHGEFFFSAGNCDTVGVIGHILCGGYGYFGRYFGLASDQVLEFQFVFPNGTVATANENFNRDLFWAFRGSCSSAFGIITSVTLKIQKHVTKKFTKIVIPANDKPRNCTNVQQVQAFMWWQQYVPLESPKEFGSVLVLQNGILIENYFIGSKEEAILAVGDSLISGLKGIFSETEILNSFVEMDFLDIVKSWTHVNSLSDLLNVRKLPPINSRKRMKGSALFAYENLSEEGVETMVDLLSSRVGDFIFKAYGGVNPLSPNPIHNEKSPLNRGHIFSAEFENYWDLNSPNLDVQNSRNIESALSVLSSYFITNTSQYLSSYPGYMDIDIPNLGEAYFGKENTRELQIIREKHDLRLFSSRASRALYPISELNFYIGSLDGTISRWSLNLDNYHITFLNKIETLGIPSWLLFTSDGKTLISINEISDMVNSNCTGIVELYSISSSGNLEFLDRVISGGGYPNFGNFDFLHSHLYISHGSGNISVMEILPDPYLTSLSVPFQILTIPGVPTDGSCDIKLDLSLRSITIDGETGFVTGGKDSIYIYKYFALTGKFGEVPEKILNLPYGSGPKRFVVHPTGKFAFILSEYSSTITMFQYYKKSRDLSVLAVISTLRINERPENKSFLASEILCSSDGQYLYASNCDISNPNQNRSSIAVFRVQDHFPYILDIQHIYSGGEFPGHISFFGGNYMIVTNTNTDTITVFSVNQQNGFLQLLASTPTHLFINKPRHVLPVKVPFE